ncbi:MAG: FAD-dependent oxidoreductase [bacterium]|nr:FAD-dependent oxidoreductase [bacterium]
MAVRSVEIDKCIGCGTCVESCPMDVFRLDTIVEKRPETSPCSIECPLGLNQREYHNLIKLHLLDEAAGLLQKNHPMPSITGRICPHPCESECSRKLVDESININGLEQYLGDYSLENEKLSRPVANGVKIAVIGSGPAGLSTAHYLTLSGYGVTVFEKDSKPGGLLRYGIPSFRLSEETLDKQIGVYEKIGIAFETDTVFGIDVTREELKNKGYKAFVAATGASKPLTITVPGSEAEGIINAISFLEKIKKGEISEVTSKVAVIGGGSVALDAARSAIRLGADEVHVICLEQVECGKEDSMPAHPSEIKEAKEEGVIIHGKMGVESFIVDGNRISAVSCIECISITDGKGRFSPEYGKSLDRLIEAATVIIAIGQTVDPVLVPRDFPLDKNGLISADSATLQVDSEMFAAGDVVTGPSTVVEALATGKKAALVIDRFIKGKELTIGLDEVPVKAGKPSEDREIYQAQRINRDSIAPGQRTGNFRETRQSLRDSQVMSEAERCLTCGSRSKIAYMDDCQVCRLCAHYCPADAIRITDGALLGSLHLFNVVKLGKALRE